MWQIPITDDITSIGIVTQKKNFAGSRQDREQFFWNAVSSRPKLYDALRAATQLRTFREEGDYSYAMKQILNSSRFAQQDILLALERNDFSRESFHTFETMIGRGTKNWYDFINVYYRLNVLFTYFISDRRYRLDVLKLLQGDVYDEEQPPVLAKMRKMAADVEETPGHICRDLLGSLTANAFLPA
jgi:FADH2 O2-dependent halogenase